MFRAVVLGLSALAVFAAGSAWLVLYPPVPADLDGAPDLDHDARPVRIPVGEGDALDGWLVPGRGGGLVVMFHGYGRAHDRTWRYGAFLREAGFSLLTVDFRSSRAARRAPTTLGHLELEDARATLDWVAARPDLAREPLGLLGESLGGSVALAVAAERPAVRAVLADCPFASSRRAIEDSIERFARMPRWPLAPLARRFGEAATGRDPGAFDVLEAAARLRDRPLFLVHVGRDNRLDPSQARDLWRAAGAKDSLWFVPEAGHNEAWQFHRARYEREARAFFERHLRAGAGASAAS